MNGIGDGKVQGSLKWRKSSHSGPSGECVELAVDGTVFCVRDSKDPNGPMVRLARAGRLAFAEAVRQFTEG
ncbi:DUF397 domain-containing protein [Actinomadura macra]|uniref:DUF397 domain-containing protein n=1 Tax=Actinomadura macra TaxID=46164 RepID=UPI000832BAAA|nr:DUF397 domain-containing protein [Actinomadura macra]